MTRGPAHPHGASGRMRSALAASPQQWVLAALLLVEIAIFSVVGTNFFSAEAAYQDAPWNADELKDRLERIGAEHGLKLGKTQAPVRVAVTGRTVGLPLFESLEILGRDRTLTRIAAARAVLIGV